MSTARSEDIAASVGVSGSEGWTCCVLQRNIQPLLKLTGRLLFGLDLESRPSECLEVWVLVPGLIKEMLFRGEKIGERCGYLVIPEILLNYF